jgi:serine/threonine protein kinase
LLFAGTNLGPYTIEGLLGTGGMGEVYRARDSRLGRRVAIKVLPQQLAADPVSLERFRREARAVAALSHPNIVAIFDVGNDSGLQYAVTEFLDGETLRDRIARDRLTPRDALTIVLEIADGVAAAHSAEIIHRDLKPENVFITTTGRIKVLDFGLARAPTARTSHEAITDYLPTEPGMIMGTVGYLAPEQAELRPLSKATDVFALGCILYEAITGVVPFEGLSTAHSLAALIRDPAPRLPPGDDLSHATDGLIQRCLTKDPTARIPDAAALAAEIRTLLTDDDAVLRMSTQARRSVRRQKRWPVYALVAILVLAVPAAFYVRHENEVIDDGYDIRMSDVRGDEEVRRLTAIALRTDSQGNRANAMQLLEQAHRSSTQTALPAAFLASWFDASGNAKEERYWTSQATARLRAGTPTYEAMLVRYLSGQRNQQNAKALALAQSMLNIRPNAWRLRLGAAHLLLAQRDNEAALLQLKKIDIERPDDRRLMLVLADRASLGDVDNAARDLQRSRLMRQPVFSTYTLGRFAWTRGDVDGAIHNFGLCADRAAADSLTTLEIDARMYQALAWLKRGDMPNARRSLSLCIARARQLQVAQREYDCAGIWAYVANREGDFAERDRKLEEAQSFATHEDDAAVLRVFAIRLRSEVWKSWPRPRVENDAVLTGAGPLIDAREAWLAGDSGAALQNLRRARAEGIDGTGLREEAELLAAELGEPSTLLRADPPYPNIFRYLAIFDLQK